MIRRVVPFLAVAVLAGCGVEPSPAIDPEAPTAMAADISPLFGRWALSAEQCVAGSAEITADAIVNGDNRCRFSGSARDGDVLTAVAFCQFRDRPDVAYTITAKVAAGTPDDIAIVLGNANQRDEGSLVRCP